MASVVLVLLYGLDIITLENKDLRTKTPGSIVCLRRCIEVKASDYSHVANEREWKVAGRPTLPS